MVAGERITSPTQLMLGDIVHFTNAALESNRDRDYLVEEVRLDSITVSTRGTFFPRDKYTYTILAAQLEELGTKIVY